MEAAESCDPSSPSTLSFSSSPSMAARLQTMKMSKWVRVNGQCSVTINDHHCPCHRTGHTSIPTATAPTNHAHNTADSYYTSHRMISIQSTGHFHPHHNCTQRTPIHRSCSVSSSSVSPIYRHRLSNSLLPLFWFVLLTLLHLIGRSPSVHGFNLDNKTALIHHGPTGTFFGFDVSLHRDRTVNWLLVGAPRAQTDQPGVERGGAVYRCSTDTQDACQQIPFDITGHSMTKVHGKPEQADSKSHQWMGAVVRSSGAAAGTDSGVIVACAPRYVYFSSNFRRREPVGTCWVSRGSFTGFLEYSPCRSTSWGYHRQGSCQAGFSASITHSGRVMYVGAPGSWYWQGQMYSIDLNLPSNASSMYATQEAPEYDDDSYLGYSSTVGHFGGSSTLYGPSRSADQDVAVGMPRGQNLTGKIVVYDSHMRNLFNITGEQMGSYFGYALATADINGDHMDDLVIGAPLYSDPAASKRGAYERGRVYVAYQINRDLERARSGKYFEIRTVLDWPDESRARFGLSLVNVGDLNKDSYDDLAVGAPYGGPNNRGVVFIYMGATKGDQVTLAQRIYAEEFGDAGLKTFGFSLSGGLDVDGNLYPDLLIGAYESDRVIQLRSRPVVNMSASLGVDPEIIHLERKMCTLRDGSRVACVSTKFCFQYTGLGLDNKINLIVTLKLDSAARRTPRLFFLDKEGLSEDRYTITLVREVPYCDTKRLYLTNTVKDKLTPLKVELEYALHDPLPESRVLKPILNKSVPNRIMKQVIIQKDCGNDNVCKPDLRVQLKSNMKEYLIGSSKRIELNVAVQNKGEDAFESVLNLFMPMDVNFVKINNKQKDELVTCTGAEPDRTGINVLTCDIGNPMKGGRKIEFDVLVEPAKVPTGSAAPDYTFIARANSSNVEADNLQHDNQVEEGIPVRVEVNLTSTGMASLDSVLVNVSEPIPEDPVTDEEIGPEVIHTYHLINRGPSAVRSARVVILWPTKNIHDQHLLYLMEQPIVKAVRAQASCRPLYGWEVNPIRVRATKRTAPAYLGYPTIQPTEGPIGPQLRPTWSVGRSYVNLKNQSLYDDHKNAADHKEGTTTTDLTRERRHVRGVTTTATPPLGGSSLEDLLSCGRSQCTKIECEITDLERDSSVSFMIRSRLWRDTIRETMLEEVFISSKLVTLVNRLPYDVNPAYLGPQVAAVYTKVLVTGMDRPRPIPLWIIIAAVVGGLLALALLAYLLYKLGFFVRTKVPTDEFEREPLRARK